MARWVHRGASEERSGYKVASRVAVDGAGAGEGFARRGIFGGVRGGKSEELDEKDLDELEAGGEGEEEEVERPKDRHHLLNKPEYGVNRWRYQRKRQYFIAVSVRAPNTRVIHHELRLPVALGWEGFRALSFPPEGLSLVRTFHTYPIRHEPVRSRTHRPRTNLIFFLPSQFTRRSATLERMRTTRRRERGRGRLSGWRSGECWLPMRGHGRRSRSPRPSPPGVPRSSKRGRRKRRRMG